jgi:glycosyltransferase involved in cell wall biosynthesis
MVTSLPSAYPWKRDKLEVIGQGIDTELFAPDGTPADDPPMILSAGRLSPVKDHPTLLRALKLCRERGRACFQAVILGGPATAADEAYARSLHAMTRDLGLAGCVRFEPARPLSELPPWYRRSTLNVNMTRTGSGDKTVLEAMSCERLCVFANEGFCEVAGPHAAMLFFRGGSETELCERIESCLSLPAGKHVETRQSLRQFVIENHGLARLAGRVVSILRSLETSASG